MERQYNMGTLDADAPVTGKVNGRWNTVCPYYMKWSGMMQLTYRTKYQGMNVCDNMNTMADEWRVYSTFRRWCEEYMDRYNLESIAKLRLVHGLQVPGCMHHSPVTSDLVPLKVESMIRRRQRRPNTWALGASYRSTNIKPFTASKVPRNAENRHLTPRGASKAYHQCRASEVQGLANRITVDRWSSGLHRYHRHLLKTPDVSKELIYKEEIKDLTTVFRHIHNGDYGHSNIVADCLDTLESGQLSLYDIQTTDKTVVSFINVR